MGKIPTAEEIYQEITKRRIFDMYNPNIKKAMIEFAKLHVEAALKEVLENVPYLASTDTVSNSQIKEAVLNSYSLENIK